MDQESGHVKEMKEVQDIEEISIEQNTSPQQSDLLNNMKEHEHMAEAESSNIVETPQNEVFLIDASGKQYEDNICDFTARREPVPSYADSDCESDTSSSSVSSLSSFSSLEDLKDAEKNTKQTTRQTKSVKTKGELGIEDLPPVEELTITVPEEDMEKTGKVYSIVDQLVVVESFENSRPLDLDSVLFLSNGKPLGHVFDVFGPVKQPYYLIRFNSEEDIHKRGIVKEESVYYAPSHAEVTNFIFTDELMRQKGSDASWEHNNEPPEEHIDFSDDEKEMAARKKRAAKSRKPSTQEDAVVHKRLNTSSDARNAVTPDVTVVFSSNKSNYFHRYGRTGNSVSYSPFAAPPVQRTTENSEFDTTRRTTKNFAFSWAASSQTKSPQRLQFPQNPMPSVVRFAGPPNFTSLPRGNQNMLVTSPCGTPGNFSLPSSSHMGMPQMMPSQQTTFQQSPVPLSPPSHPVNSNNLPFTQEPNQNLASTYRIPGSFSLPPPSQPQGIPSHQRPLQLMPTQQSQPQVMLPRQGSPQGMLPRQGSPQGMPPQQGPPWGMPPQQRLLQDMTPQQGLPQVMPPQQGPPQGMPPQQGPPQSMPPQQGPPQSMPPQQGPPQGMSPQQGPPHGMPPQQGPPQGMPPQQGLLQGMPPQQGLLQGMPPQQGLLQGMPPHQGPPQGMPPHQGPPQSMPPHQGPSQGMSPQQGPPQGMPSHQGPPQDMHPQQGPSQGMPPQQGPPQGMPPQQGPPQGMPPQQGPPQGMLPQQGPPQGMSPQQGMPPQQISFQQCLMPSSTHTLPINPTNLMPVHKPSQNVPQVYTTAGIYSVPPPSLTESTQRMSSQQMLIQSTSAHPPSTIASADFNRRTPSQGTNSMFKIPENTPFSSPPSVLPGPSQRMPFHQNSVPFASATTLASNRFSGSRASFQQTESQRFQRCEKYAMASILQNMRCQAFDKISYSQQTPVSVSGPSNVLPRSLPTSSTYSSGHQFSTSEHI